MSIPAFSKAIQSAIQKTWTYIAPYIRRKLLFVGIGSLLTIGGITAVAIAQHNTSQELASVATHQPISAQQEQGIVAGDSTAQPAADATVPSALAPSANRGNQSNARATAPSPKGPVKTVTNLIFSPSKVVLGGATGKYAYVQVTAEGGAQFYMPTFTSLDSKGIGVMINNSPSPAPSGGSLLRATWEIVFVQYDQNALGSASVDVAAITTSTMTTMKGAIQVQWQPIPNFSVRAGSVPMTSMTDTTVTYTAHLLLTTNKPHFGNPTIKIRIESYGCLPGSDVTKEVRYTGQDDITITCIAQRIYPYVPGSGTTPPLNTETSFWAYVDAQFDSGAYASTNSGKITFYTAPQLP